MTARQMKVAVAAFLALAIGITINAMFFQSDPAAIAAAEARAQRAAARAALGRGRAPGVAATASRSARGRDAGSAARNGAVRIRNKNALRRASQVRLDAAKLPAPPLQLQRPGLQSRALVRAIQRELKKRSYEPGLIDGEVGLVTRAAIMAFEYDQGAPLTGEPGARLLRRILLGGGGRRRLDLPLRIGARAARVIRNVQLSLKTHGYPPGKPDGIIGAETRRAIREFEMDHGIVPKGRVSGQVVAQLARLANQRGRLASRRK